MYYENLKSCSISFYINDKEYKINSFDPIQWDNVHDDFKEVQVIDIRQDKYSDKIFGYFTPHKKTTKMYLDTYNNSNYKLATDEKYLENTISKGVIIIKSVYMKEWRKKSKENQRSMGIDQGGRYIQRCNKVLEHFNFKMQE